jgi:GNAT superfamily N-acetyltransferase
MDRVAELYAKGISYTRSRSHPYPLGRVNGIWVMRDGPRKLGEPRREEWVTHGMRPTAVDRLARKRATGRYAICVIRGLDQPVEPMREEFAALGYRQGFSESLLLHRLEELSKPSSPLPIRQVFRTKEIDALTLAAGHRLALREELSGKDATMRQYAVWDGHRPVAWAQSLPIGRWTWCCNIHVLPSYRRRGVGEAMLTKLLADDKANGSAGSVMLARNRAAAIYAGAGYEELGELLVFMPRRTLRVTAR